MTSPGKAHDAGALGRNKCITFHSRFSDRRFAQMAKLTRPTRLNLSRREFTRGAAMAAATAVVPKPSHGDERARDSGDAQTASSQAAQLTPDAEAHAQVIHSRGSHSRRPAKKDR